MHVMFICAALLPATAIAATPEQEAKDVYLQGAAKFEAGELEVALELFKKAEALVPAPMPKYRIAATLDRLGRPAEAIAAYQTFIDSRPDPDKFFSKVENAKTRIRALARLPAKLRVKTTPEAPPNLVVAIDDVPQSGTELVLAPGTHVITATAGLAKGGQTVELQPGETREVMLSLVEPQVVIAAPAVVAPPPAPPVVAAPVQLAKARSSAPVAYALFGLGAAEIVAGGVFGMQALSARKDFEASGSRDSHESAGRQALLADVFFATGATLVLAGAAVLWLDAPTEPQLEVMPIVTPNAAGAAARIEF
jgi:tetratricopeptide (TPR) repeat protein